MALLLPAVAAAGLAHAEGLTLTEGSTSPSSPTVDVNTLLGGLNQVRVGAIADAGLNTADYFVNNGVPDASEPTPVVSSGVSASSAAYSASPQIVTPTLTGAKSAVTAGPASTVIGTVGDGKIDYAYDPATGDIKFQLDGAGNFLTTSGAPSYIFSIQVGSASGQLRPQNINPAFTMGTTALTLTSTQLSSALSNSPGFTDGFDLGFVLPAGLTNAQLTSDLTVKYQIFNNGTLKNADVVVPEPTSLAFLGVGAAGLMARRRRKVSAPRQ